MEPITIKGYLIHIGEIQEFPSGFRKLEFVIEEDCEKFPQKIKMELAKDKVLIMENFKLNDLVTAQCNLRGNEFNGKFFVNLQAWKVVGDGMEARDTRQNGVAPPQDAHNQAKSNGYAPEDDVEDDIPF